MRAFVMNSFDEPPDLIDYPAPEVLGPCEIRVQVKATSINAFDVKYLTGLYRGVMPYEFPIVGGSDFAGIVDDVGPEVTTLRVGEAVMGFAKETFAEYVVLDESKAVHKPKPLEFVEAGAIPLAGATALLCVEACAPSPGEIVLVCGASGGVGSFAVQLTQLAGAHVIATGLPEDEAYLRDLGADDVLDYRQDLKAAIKASHPLGVDCLIDLVNTGERFDDLCDVVRERGRVASSLEAADERKLSMRNIQATNVSTEKHRDAVSRIGEYAEIGDIRVPIEETYKLEEIGDAIEAFKSEHSMGKISIWLG